MSESDFGNEVEIARMGKNARSEIVARLVTVRGVPCADVRVYATGTAGKSVPTKAGLCFAVERLSEFRALVDKLIEAAGPSGPSGSINPSGVDDDGH